MSTKITIIGAGPGGYVAAIRAAQRGADVTVVEDREVGGTCLNWGCIPTKTIISTTDVLHHVRHAGEFGIDISGEVTYSLERIRERKDAVVAVQVRGIRELFKSWNVKLLPARGSLLAPDAVRVAQQDGTTMDLRSDRIIIATGSRPAALPGVHIDGETVLTSDDAVRLARVPESMLIVGAGVIGCEFAFIYRSLGCEVTVVEMADRALPTEDKDISAVIEREFKKAKIKLMTKARIERLIRNENGQAETTLLNGATLSAEQALVSIGRRFNTEGLDLDAAGVGTGPRGEIAVNERMETSVPGIFAVGDVTGKMMLAHVASHQGLVAVENALGGNAVMDYRAVPAGIFTRPEIGSVGLRQHEAEEQRISIRTGTFPYRALGKAHAMGEIVGLVKVIADAATDRVLGVHIVGAHASDIVHEGALAIMIGATARQLAEAVHAHPTLSEGVMEAAGDVWDQAIHVPKRKSAK